MQLNVVNSTTSSVLTSRICVHILSSCTASITQPANDSQFSDNWHLFSNSVSISPRTSLTASHLGHSSNCNSVHIHQQELIIHNNIQISWAYSDRMKWPVADGMEYEGLTTCWRSFQAQFFPVNHLTGAKTQFHCLCHHVVTLQKFSAIKA